MIKMTTIPSILLFFRYRKKIKEIIICSRNVSLYEKWINEHIWCLLKIFLPFYPELDRHGFFPAYQGIQTFTVIIFWCTVVHNSQWPTCLIHLPLNYHKVLTVKVCLYWRNPKYFNSWVTILGKCKYRMLEVSAHQYITR